MKKEHRQRVVFRSISDTYVYLDPGGPVPSADLVEVTANLDRLFLRCRCLNRHSSCTIQNTSFSAHSSQYYAARFSCVPAVKIGQVLRAIQLFWLLFRLLVHYLLGASGSKGYQISWLNIPYAYRLFEPV